MDDMQAIEQRISREMLRRAGPSESVDDLAVFEAVTAASRSHGWGFTMFSALKFIAASVIVALFGGFLLAGVFTTQQGDEMVPAAVTASPATEASTTPTEPTASSGPSVRTDILPGVELTVEEVEPGVFHVVNDGVRDIAPGTDTDVVAGYDGGIWFLQKNRFLRLGSDAEHAWPMGAGPDDHVLEVAPDGTLWVIPSEMYEAPAQYPDRAYPDLRDGAGLRSDDGEVWTTQSCPGMGCRGLTIAPDGTVWASWEQDGRWRVGHLGPAGWQRLDGEGQGVWATSTGNNFIGYHRLFPTDAGDLYGAECYGACELFHSGGGDWDYLLADGSGVGAFVFDVGRDGTVWLVAEGLVPPVTEAGKDLARFADGEWTGWTSDALSDIRFGLGLDYQFEVAPDGSAWFSLWQSADGTDPGLGRDSRSWWDRRGAVEDGRLLCDGLARFDGQTLDRFLLGQCISMDIAADGSTWILADEDEGKDLYVITLEAVAAAG